MSQVTEYVILPLGDLSLFMISKKNNLVWFFLDLLAQSGTQAQQRNYLL